MGWIHNTEYAPAHEHEGFAEPVLDPELLPADARGLRLSPTALASAHGGAVTGWRAACTCGWSSQKAHPRADYPAPDRSAYLAPDSVEEGPAQSEWNEHVEAAVPELGLHQLAERRTASDAALSAEVRMLRLANVSWERIGTAAGMSRQSAWEKWRHLDVPVHDLPAWAPSGPSRQEFLPGLLELRALARPHLLRQDVDPAMAAVEQAMTGLRRLLAPAGPADTDDAVARLARAADYARAVHAAMVDDAQALAAADPDLISVERATVAAYDPITDDTHILDVRWEGGLDTPTILRVGERTLTDPVELQRVASALAVLAEAAANTVHPNDADVATA
jgi:hypothetical protein